MWMLTRSARGGGGQRRAVEVRMLTANARGGAQVPLPMAFTFAAKDVCGHFSALVSVEGPRQEDPPRSLASVFSVSASSLS
eukprot:3416402-Rhodomonas_salina.1